ncbi:MAG TPA: peptidase T4 [Actinomycetales bacterium]|nr:peptidase T4 [Actinomycetales bacterium]
MRYLRGRDDGSAVVEFVTLGVLLLVPVVYLVLTLGRIQAAAFAAEGAAREAGRAFVTAPDETSAAQRVRAAVLLAARDQGFDEVDPADAVDIQCSTVPCLQPESRVVVRVEIEAVLPGVPAFIDAVVPTRVTVSAESVAVVGRFG